MSDTAAKAIAEKKNEESETPKPLGTIEFEGQTFDVLKKPNPLLLSELARTGSEDPEAFGVIAEFFEHTLGKATYSRFKKAYYASDAADDAAVLMGKLQEVLEATMGRPTE